jgi:hypothetical protein
MHGGECPAMLVFFPADVDSAAVANSSVGRTLAGSLIQFYSVLMAVSSCNRDVL